MTAVIRRILDIIVSLLGLVFTLPVTGVVMLILASESPLHIFFAQTRMGLNGRPFQMYKFRKFPINWKDHGPGVTVAFDSRMTKLGMFLERTKIDELPQLWNILRGDMSVVGPRPESMAFKDLYVGEFAEVLRFKPGIFGPNQIKFRNEAEMYPPDVPPEQFYREVLFPQKARNDLAYFRQSSLFRDVIFIVSGAWRTLAGIINWRRAVNLHIRIIAADLLMIEAAHLIAYLARYSGFPPPPSEQEVFWLGVVFLPPVLIVGMALFGCYRNPVRFFFVPDALRLIAAGSFLWLFFFIILFSIHRNLSLYIIPLVWAFLIIALMIPRVAIKFLWELKPLDEHRDSTANILIYGAGRIGTVMSGLIDGHVSPMRFVGFVDDNPDLRGRRIQGYEVLGRESDIPTVYAVHKFDEIWITFKPDEIKRARLLAFCQKHPVKLISLAEMEPFSRIYDS